MKKDEVKVGSTYTAKISDKVVPVRITEEKWTGDKHTGRFQTLQDLAATDDPEFGAVAAGLPEAPPRPRLAE